MERASAGVLVRTTNARPRRYYSKKADGIGPDFAYIYDELGGMFELFNYPELDERTGRGINDAGTVCGFSRYSQRNARLLGMMTILNDPEANATAALELNIIGLAVGSYTDKAAKATDSSITLRRTADRKVNDPAGPGPTWSMASITQATWLASRDFLPSIMVSRPNRLIVRRSNQPAARIGCIPRTCAMHLPFCECPIMTEETANRHSSLAEFSGTPTRRSA